MIEIQFQYRPFAELKVKHNYYVKNLNRDVRFVPTTQSARLAEAMGVLIKNSENGISLSYDVVNSDGLLHYLLNNEDIEFSFILTTTNSSFVNFTDMATESVGTIFYFNTLNARKIKDDNYLLHKAEHVSKDDRLPIKKGDFYYNIESSKEAHLELKDEEGRTVIDQKVTGLSKYLFQMGRLKQGCYTVCENGKEKMRFAYVTQKLMRQTGIAMVTVSLKGKEKKELIATLEKGEVLPSKEFTLHFDSRSTYWKYFIVSKYKLPLEKSSIHSEGQDIPFKGPDKVKLPNGDTAYLFEASTPLPLIEVPKYNLKLSKSKRAGGNGEAYLNRLPTPTPDSIKPESRSESSKVYSELIVYI
ncbi:hypothetical protein JMN32_05900 [Fulvivirga sp. 29W222]|uniref:Uncharacterized protein n=1 Tax=Fulvivirga marina TaxID=2494733 RepID=A0A937FWT3_9BACT|nr:hypothetical protein [Fulvivirga marina]MBL6445830.1 hypothetical protein [Fulvivirga marina]